MTIISARFPRAERDQFSPRTRAINYPRQRPINYASPVIVARAKEYLARTETKNGGKSDFSIFRKASLLFVTIY